MTPEREFENEVVLAMVQAFLGFISPRMRAIGLETHLEDKSVDLHVAVLQDDPEDREFIDEAIFSFDAVTIDDILVNVHMWVAEDWVTAWRGRGFRRIFVSSED